MRETTVFLPAVYEIVVRNDGRAQHPSHYVREDVPLSIRHVDSARKVLSVSWGSGRTCDWFEVDGQLYRPFLGLDGKPLGSIEAFDLELAKRAGRELFQDYPLRTCFTGPHKAWRSPYGQPTRDQVQPKRADRVLSDGREAAIAQAMERAGSLLLVGDTLMTASSAPVWCVGNANRPRNAETVSIGIPDHPDWEAPIARFALGDGEEAETLAHRIMSRFPDDRYGDIKREGASFETFGGWEIPVVDPIDPVDAWRQVRKMFGSVRMDEMPFDVLASIVKGEEAALEWKFAGDREWYDHSMSTLRQLASHPVFERYGTGFYTKEIQAVVMAFEAADGFVSELTEDDVDVLSMGVR